MQTRLLWDYLEQIVVTRVRDDLCGHSAAENGVSLDVAGAVNVDAGDDAFVQSPRSAKPVSFFTVVKSTPAASGSTMRWSTVTNSARVSSLLGPKRSVSA